MPGTILPQQMLSAIDKILYFWLKYQLVSKMVNKILVKLTVVRKKDRYGRALYRSPRIYLPTRLTDDSSFPFKERQPLLVRVLGEKLVIEKVRKVKRKS